MATRFCLRSGLTFTLYLTFITSFFGQNNALTCETCEYDQCPEVTCVGSKHLDACGCCLECSKQESESCGGLFNIHGQCENGLKCVQDLDVGSMLPGYEIGTCQKISDLQDSDDCMKSLHFGCNVVDDECVCEHEFACSNPFRYSSQHMCQMLKSSDQTSRLDCSNTECSVEQSVTCPEDTVLVEGFVPPGECCPRSSRCECRPEICGLNLCPPETFQQLVSRGNGTVESCCDVYKCNPVGESDECATVRCSNLPLNGISCPSDSIVVREPPTKCCLGQPVCQCISTVCQATQCPPGKFSQVSEKGKGNPGSCCDVFTCVDAPSEAVCVVNGTLLKEGTFVIDEDCNACTCVDSIRQCTRLSCPKLPCKHVFWPPGGCCPICDDPPPEEDPFPFLPLCRDGENIYMVGQKWTMDKCTFCTCVEGGVKQCIAAYCNDAPVVSTSLPCPELNSCPLNDRTCPHGLLFNENGCPTCLCYGDNPTCPSMNSCALSCRRGYAIDKRGCRICKCQRKKCRTLPQCRKQCPYGYKRNKNGCDRCQCRSCPPLDSCTKQCIEGLAVNKYGCKVCRCKALRESVSHRPKAGSSTSGLACFDPVLGSYHDDGETWSSNCYICVCRGGQVMCDLLRCPTPSCDRPKFDPDSCCAICPDEGNHPPFIPQSLSCRRFDPLLVAEGDTWDVNSCLSCTCHSNHLMCSTKQCPPVTCKSPTFDNSSCCPICQDSPVLPGGNTCRTENGSVYKSGQKFAIDPCSNCVCRNGDVTCFTQTCDSNLQCSNPVVKRGQCCPQCLEEITAVSYQRNDMSCTRENGEVHESGSEFQTDSCTSCVCRSGKIKCTTQACPLLESCSRVLVTGKECCPQCIDDHSESKRGCDENGELRSHAEEWNVTTSHCVTCVCVNGNVICREPYCVPIPITCEESAVLDGACCTECLPLKSNPVTEYPVIQTPTNSSKSSPTLFIVLGATVLILIVMIAIFVKRKCVCKKGKYNVKKANPEVKEQINFTRPLLDTSKVV